MKLKAYITNIVAILSLVILVSGFQIQLSESDDISLEGIVGMETAYAGPCGAAGCDGADMYCTSVTVVHIGNWQMKKDCKGNPPEEKELPEQK
ncbi:hypothetical protein ACFSVN_08310 [Gracilimonas halophila]|uniref:NVEALA protein n=2 Tax=Gracilimonas halophila TaxID=1834464 RepID=A0ABW5JLG4_9BACT